MNCPRFLCRSLFHLLLSWTLLASAWAAENAEEPSNAQPELERPAVVQPQKKRARHRTPATHRSRNDRVEIGKDVTIGPGETVNELVVVAGNATVDGTVEGNLVVLSGTAKVNGHVREDLITILGSASLGPDARIGQDAVVVGGPLDVSPQATISGQQTVVALGQMLPDFMWLQKWLSKGLFLARPFPPQVKWVWGVAGLFLLVYLAMTLMFPRPVRACVGALEEQPVASFFIGLLLLVLLGPLLFLLVVSVAGVLAIPFVVCALIAAALFGKVAVYAYAGQQLGRQLNGRDLSLPLMLVLGAALFYLVYMVPVLGFAVWGVITLIGLGAVLLACFGSFRHEETPPLAQTHTLNVTAPPGLSEPGAAGSGATVAAMPPMLSSADAALLPRVGFWRRFCATALDFILLILLIHLTGPLFVLVWAAYHVAMWAWRGTTVGGIVMGIKIVRTDGRPIDFPVALVRSLSSFFSAFALFLGFFWAGWDKDRQAWHDKIAGTVIVRVPRSVPLI